MAQRIFGEGKAADGGMIGVYDKSPMYVNPGVSPKKFSTSGKGGKTKFKNGKIHKTRFFRSGYSEFRAAAGRQNSHVDLRLTGTLEASFVLGQQGDSYVSGFINEKQAKIAEGNEERFETTVFELTQKEQETFLLLLTQ